MAKKLTIDDVLVPKEKIPYEVPKNWCWVKLGGLVNEVKNGTTIKQNKDEIGPKVTRIESVQNNKIDFNRIGYITEEEKIKDSDWYEAGDIALSHINSIEHVGKTALIEEDYLPLVHGMNLLRIRLKKELINPKYFAIYTQGYDFKSEVVDRVNRAVNQVSLNQKRLNEIPIAVPPLAEQERIVNRVESLFDKVDKAAGLVDEARDGFEKRRAAILERAFSGELTRKWREENGVSDQKIVNSSSENGYNIPESWSWTTVEDVMTVKGGKRLPKGEKLLDENTGFPYIKAGDLKRGTVLIDNLQYISKDIHEKIKNYYVNSGDVYITIVGACIGDVGVIPEELDGANLTENAAKLCPNENLNSKFIARYLSSNFAQVMLKSDIASATLGKLSLTKIKKFMVPLPPIEEQDEIVKVLEKILNNEHNIIDLIELDENISIIKKSILAKAFRGDLGSNDLDEESSFELLKSIL